ncbi:enhancer of filamentation 1-like isoform X2 [Babylonia areolata]|uniref:enhancer of filamentation 1-like isoform X2 n=1 Tax=Babylonia areolata TaxID=304850 RepID=UPI003FCFB016
MVFGCDACDQVEEMFLAKALYDNVAETPDELSFRRGDVVTVLDQDTAGLEGWWLCSLRGRQGIAPGNRLKILSGMGEAAGGAHHHNGPAGGDWQRTLEKSPLSKVMTPAKAGEACQHQSNEDYDVPPSSRCSLPPSKEPSPEPATDLYHTPSSHLAVPGPSGCRRPSCERTTPPGSQRGSLDSQSSASSAGGHHHLYQTLPGSRRVSAESRPRRLSAAERLYDTPPGSKRASVERTLGGDDDDQPIYDTPTAGIRPVEVPGESTYDTPSPSPGSRRQSRDSSTGAGSRGSGVSSSSESCMSGSSSSNLLLPGSKAGSLPDSARSSLDASLPDNTYDLAPREGRAVTQLSTDSGLGLYDTPAPGRHQPPSSPLPGTHVPGTASHPQLSEYAGGEKPSPCEDLKRSRSLEHAVDDIYDSPRNNAPRVNLKEGPACSSLRTQGAADPNAVYDVPPQVTRDSVISARSDSSSEDSARLSSCSTDCLGGSGPADNYQMPPEGAQDELLLDVDSALEVLVKRQQDVTRSSSRLLALVTSPSWRSKESLQTHLVDLRTACGQLKKAVGEFVDFAQGAVANAAQLSDRKLMNRLTKQFGPLQQQRKALSAAVRGLEDRKWQIALLAEPPPPSQSDCPDDLGTVVSLAQDLVPPVKKLASLLQANAAVLFRRSGDQAGQSRGAEDSHVVSKPPIGPKSDLLLCKPGGVGGGGSGVGVVIQRPRSVQQRPLPPTPPVPLSERPLPPTPSPLQTALRDLDKLDYINVESVRGGLPPDDDDNGDRDYSDLQQDYDYVHVDSLDAEAQQQSREERQRQAAKDAADDDDEPDTPKTPTPGKAQFDNDAGHRQGGGEDRDLNMNAGQRTDNAHTTNTNRHHQGIDRLPSLEDNINALYSHSQEDGEDLNQDEGDLKTPMNKNGFTLPDPHDYSSGYVDLSQTTLTASDKQVLVYYSGQLETHSTLLNNAIDAFFACIESGEPPKVFISNSKFVIVTAHKLVYISDALHRNLTNGAVRSKVMQCANHVCQCLKVSVQATKTAALQFPSVPAVQEMVDRVVDVSHAAHELKLVITQASAL